ncbi:MAG: hypothetical protein ACTHMA_06520 [Thermomicrobiales bacterium]
MPRARSAARQPGCDGVHHLQRCGEVRVAVREREAGVPELPGGAVGVQVDAARQAAEDEGALQLLVNVDEVGGVTHRLAPPEVEAEARAQPVRQNGQAVPV